MNGIQGRVHNAGLSILHLGSRPQARVHKAVLLVPILDFGSQALAEENYRTLTDELFRESLYISKLFVL